METATELYEWDPLSDVGINQAELLNEARRLQIRNILQSYTGFYDVFSELIQNSLDSLDLRAAQEQTNYQPTLWISINIKNQSISVTDNGMGLTRDQLRLFLQPNLTFKRRGVSRGSKGVGATFLAYGFNYLQVATHVPGFSYSGTLLDGRAWAEDTETIVPRPQMRMSATDHDAFTYDDQGTSFTIALRGDGVRPKDLGWIGATTAKQWAAVLRIKTPLGGIYLFEANKSKTVCHLEVIDSEGGITRTKIDPCEYYYPSEIGGRATKLSDLRSKLHRDADAGRLGHLSPDLTQFACIYDIFRGDDILAGTTPIKVDFDNAGESRQHLADLMRKFRPDVAVYFVYSVNYWKTFNDQTLGLRSNLRILRGGLQLATQGMIQGEIQGIPLTFATGYENTTHVIVHFRGAEPDLGRKGFQPDLMELAEELAKASVNAFKRFYSFLKKDLGPGGPTKSQIASDKHEWIMKQEEYVRSHPLVITGTTLFAPEERVPIVCQPYVEQDVVALFNQLLAAGVIRGFEVLATSEHERYDGLVKIHMDDSPKYIYDRKQNPLGVPREAVHGVFKSAPMILEYKYDLDRLIEDFSREVKFEQHIDLVVVWSIGQQWRDRYRVIPLLYDDHVHLRSFHGVTHKFLNRITGAELFDGIVLEDLVEYLHDPLAAQSSIYAKYMDEE